VTVRGRPGIGFSAKALAALVLLAFLSSGWLGPRRLAAEAQSAPTDTPFPTETKDNLVTATYDPLTPTATQTKSEGGVGGQSGAGSLIYLPLISWSVEVLPTAVPTATPLPTLMAPAAPPAALSRYTSTLNIDPTNYNDLYVLGRQRGGCDGSPTPAYPNSFLILAFGHPWDNSTPTSAAWAYGVALYPNDAVIVTLDVLERNVRKFIQGYYLCVISINPSASLTLGVGINGSIHPEWLTYEHGQRWAQMVANLTTFIQSPPSWENTIKVAGAADFEPDWGHAALLRQWVAGYASIPNSKYYFYGSCDGCPQVTRDAAGNSVAGYTPILASGSDWTLDDVWYLSYGARPAWPVPEIYETSGKHARQWQNIDDWAATCTIIPYTNTLCEPLRLGTNRNMRFAGAMTQYQACIDNGGCDPTLDNSPPAGWRLLWQALNDPNTPVTNQGALEWITDIALKQ